MFFHSPISPSDNHTPCLWLTSEVVYFKARCRYTQITGWKFSALFAHLSILFTSCSRATYPAFPQTLSTAGESVPRSTWEQHSALRVLTGCARIWLSSTSAQSLWRWPLKTSAIGFWISVILQITGHSAPLKSWCWELNRALTEIFSAKHLSFGELYFWHIWGSKHVTEKAYPLVIQKIRLNVFSTAGLTM